MPETSVYTSATFPNPPSPEVWQDGLITTIIDMLGGEDDILFVGGNSGSGKSVVLSQFVRALTSQSFCVFIRTTSKWSYDPDLIQADLLDQFRACTQTNQVERSETAEYTSLRYQIQKLTKKAGRPSYFVIDGLDSVPQTDKLTRQDILDLLPTGVPGFKCIFSGTPNDYPELKSVRNVRILPLPAWGFTEAKQLLTGVVDDGDIRKLCRLCNGSPQKLAAIRRVIQQGTSIDSILSDPASIPTIFELDLEKIQNFSDDDLLILALAAFDEIPHTVDSAAQVLGRDVTDISSIVDKVDFVEIDAGTGRITFNSEGHRGLIRDRLKRLKERTISASVDHLLKTPGSEEALMSLPSHFSTLGKEVELLSYLTPEHLRAMVSAAKSWKIAQRNTNNALNAALKLNRYDEILKLGIQEATLRSLGSAKSWRSEIEAYAALGDLKGASQVAYSAIANDDRLHRLAFLGRLQKLQFGVVEPELRDEIARLGSLIEIEELGEMALDIAADVVFTNQDLAIEIASRAVTSQLSSRERSFALGRVALGAIRTREKGQSTKDALTKLIDRINDPAFKGFRASASIILDRTSAKDVVEGLHEFDSVSSQLAILRLWCKENYAHADSLIVVGEALNRAISATKFTPTAQIYREISLPLRYNGDLEGVERLVRRFSSQKENVASIGPTNEYVRFEMSLALAECRYRQDSAFSRIQDVYLYVSDLKDHALKSASLAILASTLPQLGIPETPDKIELNMLLEKDFEDTFTHLLSHSARHYTATKEVIRAIAYWSFPRAFEVVARLNTKERRDRGIQTAVFRRCENKKMSKLDVEQMLTAISSITNPISFRQSIIRLIEALMEVDNGKIICAETYNRFSALLDKVQYLKERLRGRCLIFALAKRVDSLPININLSNAVIKITEEWESIDVDWERIESGFNIAASFADHSHDLALEMLNKTNEDRRHVSIDCSVAGWALIMCARIAICLFRGLIIAKQDVTSEYQRLESLIDRVPSQVFRCNLYCDIALAYWFAGQQALATQIVTGRIRGILDDMKHGEPAAYSAAVRYCSSSVFLVNSPSAFDRIETLDSEAKDLALRAVAQTLFTKTFLYQPYNAPVGTSYDADYDTLRLVIEILRKLKRESSRYYMTETVIEVMLSRNSKASISKEQRADLVSILENLVEAPIVDPDGIAHEGFRILAEAQVGRVRTGDCDWQSWVNRAHQLPNIADQAFTLTLLAEMMPSRFSILANSAFDQAVELTKRIPNALDRGEHFEAMAQRCGNRKIFAKKCLRAALEATSSSSSNDTETLRKRVVDLASQIDPDFASELAQVVDSDPAKSQSKTIKDALAAIETRKKVLKGNPPEMSVAEVRDFAELAENMLGQLNAGVVQPLPFDKIKAHISRAANLPIEESFWILLWASSNLVFKFAKSAKGPAILKPLFDAAIVSAELAGQIGMRNSGSSNWNHEHSPVSDTMLILAPGEREKADDFLRRWLEINEVEQLTIQDPYFGPSDLDWLQLVWNVRPDCNIRVLTGELHNRRLTDGLAVEDVYRQEWRKISAQDPGECEISLIGLRISGNSPFHDRFIVTNREGLRFGTSLNSVGKTKQAEISILDSASYDLVYQTVRSYIDHSAREMKGERIRYAQFTL